jgi:hypothetical protein
MAEKRVSVRLSATGGRQVRAELEGVGAAGTRGMGRLSRELDQANARMAAFARRAKIAATAAAAALAAAVVAMTRSTIMAANEIDQLSQVANAAPEVFQRWSAASATVGVEQEKLADILKDVNDRVGDFLQTGGGPMADFFENIAPRVGVTADQFARLSGPEALQLYVDSLERAGVSQQEMTFYLEAMASDTTRLIPLLQNGGAEMTRLGAQAQALGLFWMLTPLPPCAGRNSRWSALGKSSLGCATGLPWRSPRRWRRWPTPSWRWPHPPARSAAPLMQFWSISTGSRSTR